MRTKVKIAAGLKTRPTQIQSGNVERSSSGATARRNAKTVSRRGHRVAVPVARGDGRLTYAQFHALVKPFWALMRGGAVLEPIERTRMAEARELFGKLLVRRNHRPELHVGLANACILEYELTRADPGPDAALLQRALEHARTACRLQSRLGWTLGDVRLRARARGPATGGPGGVRFGPPISIPATGIISSAWRRPAGGNGA